jgi:metal-responsive CopG/Arc/MetJ family transcriptional regulator
MTALSLILPDAIAKASREAARKLGITRTQFIRLAVLHELEAFEAKQEQTAMAKAMIAMKTSHSYSQDTSKLLSDFPTDLPAEKDEWWIKK